MIFFRFFSFMIFQFRKNVFCFSSLTPGRVVQGAAAMAVATRPSTAQPLEHTAPRGPASADPGFVGSVESTWRVSESHATWASAKVVHHTRATREQKTGQGEAPSAR